MIKTIIQSPFVNLFSGFVLLVTAGVETWLSFEDHSLGVHHGIMVFSIIQIAKSIPEILQGLKEIDAADI